MCTDITFSLVFLLSLSICFNNRAAKTSKILVVMDNKVILIVLIYEAHCAQYN